MFIAIAFAVGFLAGRFWPQVKIAALWAYARVRG